MLKQAASVVTRRSPELLNGKIIYKLDMFRCQCLLAGGYPIVMCIFIDKVISRSIRYFVMLADNGYPMHYKLHYLWS